MKLKQIVSGIALTMVAAFAIGGATADARPHHRGHHRWERQRHYDHGRHHGHRPQRPHRR